MSTTTMDPKTDRKDAKLVPLDKDLHVFRLLQGCFEDTAPGWTHPVDADGKKIKQNPETGTPIVPKSHMYRWNEDGNNIVKSTEDLVKRYGRAKFERLTGDSDVIDLKASVANQLLVDENERVNAQLKEALAEIAKLKSPETEKVNLLGGLTGMTLKQLQVYCQDNEIDTQGCRTKEDYLAAAQLHATTK